MNIISSWLRSRSISKYKSRLPSALAKDYGKSDFYLPAKVNATLARQRLDNKHSVFALAMFCSKESFASLKSDGAFDIEYDEARLIVGRVVFNSSSSYSQADLSTSSSVAAGPNNSVEGIGGSSDGGGAGE